MLKLALGKRVSHVFQYSNQEYYVDLTKKYFPGMETLSRVKDKYSEESNGLTLEEARAIKAELHQIQKSLTVGEQEKIELMKNLARLKDDLTRIQHSDSTFDVTKQSMEKLSTASQTDLSGEVS